MLQCNRGIFIRRSFLLWRIFAIIDEKEWYNDERLYRD